MSAKRARAGIAQPGVVKLDDGIISVEVTGDMTGEYVREVREAIHRLAAQRRRRRQPVLILIDMRRVLSDTSGARSEAKKLLKGDYDRLAAYGASGDIGRVVLYILRAAQAYNRARFFDRQGEAMAWLHEETVPLWRRLKWPELLTVVIFTLLFVFMFGLWSRLKEGNHIISQKAVQAQDQEVRSTLENRLRAYTNAAYGFRAHVTTDTSFSADRFEKYFMASDISEHYPGLRTISFVRYVPADQLDSFVKQRQADPYYKQHDINYTVTKDNHDIYLLSVVAEPTPLVPKGFYGLDQARSGVREQTLLAARDSGKPAYSDRLNLIGLAEPKVKPIYGFIITIPVYRGADDTAKQRRHNIYGFINAALSYDALFSNVLNPYGRPETSYRVVSNGQTIYQTAGFSADEAMLDHINLSEGGQTFDIQAAYSKHYGLNGGQRLAPPIVLLGGLALWIGAVSLVLTSRRQRLQAVSLAEDITADLRAEKDQAEALRQKDEAILGSIGEGLIMFDPAGDIELFNKPAQKLLGYREKYLVGHSYGRLPASKTPDGPLMAEAERPVVRALRSGRVVEETIYYHRRDGRVFPALATVAPVKAGGQLIGAIEVFRDITRERELDAAKEDFLSLASHQLRTPLSTISWYSELMLGGGDENLTKEQRQYLEEIYQSNHRMVALVNSLLNVSRIDTGTFRVYPEPTDIIRLSKSIVRDLEPRIFRRKIDFVEEYPARLPKIMADPKLLSIVLENLTTNAVKYTPEAGRVVLQIARRAEQIRITVRDTGYGIPESAQDHIFTKMFRAENARQQSPDGNGLGLYICKAIIEASGGKIWFESQENRGTTFHVTLPINGKKGARSTRRVS